RRSRSALVATVVPCANTAGRGAPSRTEATPRRTARPGSCRVEGILVTLPSAATTSVNVPPVSTPIRTPATVVRSGHQEFRDVEQFSIGEARPHELQTDRQSIRAHVDGERD